jgi:ABC-2 type transport system ATP-binding protein
LACTLINEPEILLLDEPTTGVDPVSRREFWEILTDLHLSGTTIVVSTPYMDEAERCSRVGLMYAGRLMVCDVPQKIRGMVRGDLLEMQTSDWRRALALLKTLDGVYEVQTYGKTLRVFVDSADERDEILRRRLREGGIQIQELRRSSPRMEEAFISLIRDVEG